MAVQSANRCAVPARRVRLIENRQDIVHLAGAKLPEATHYQMDSHLPKRNTYAAHLAGAATAHLDPILAYAELAGKHAPLRPKAAGVDDVHRMFIEDGRVAIGWMGQAVDDYNEAASRAAVRWVFGNLGLRGAT